MSTKNPIHDHDHSHNHERTNVLIDDDDCCDDEDCGSHNHDHAHGAAVHDHGHSHGHDNDDDCCSDEECCSHNHARGNNHEHNHTHGDGSEEDCCSDEGCCSHGHGDAHASHDHEHGHSHVGDDDCCSDEGCCSHNHDSHDHDHDHSHGSTTKKSPNKQVTSDHEAVDVFPLSSNFSAPPTMRPMRVSSNDSRQLSTSSVGSFIDASLAEICALCDPASHIPHSIQVTRLRIANLCCAGEERIIRNCLEGMKGIEHVDVNIIGRYSIVKHCPVACCAPVTKIVDILNEQRLGASVSEAKDADDDTEQESINYLKLAHVLVVFLLFVAGLIAQKDYEGGQLELPSLILFCISTGLGILPVLQAAYVAVVRLSLDIHILMVVAVVGAMIDKEYLDAALLMSLFIAAEMIEEVVMQRVRRAIKTSNSGTSVPKKATLVNGKTVPVDELKVGDVITCRAGDMIQADGVVTKGEGVVDESALTGEAEPVSKKKTMRVSSGTVVQNGYVEIKIDTNIEDSTIRKLNQAVMDVQADKGEYGRIVDKVAMYWTPGVLIFAIGMSVIGGAVSKNWNAYLHKSLVMLVLACPCALVIAAPIPAVCAIAQAARNKVLIRGSTVIEKAGKITIVASDKTGTLTRGFFKVLDRLALSAHHASTHNALELAAALEAKSSHPLANAIVSAHCGCIAEMEGDLPQVKKIKTVDGVGIKGFVETSQGIWKEVHVGNDRLLKTTAFGSTIKLPLPDQLRVNEWQRAKASTLLVYIVVDNQLEMILSLSDEIRPEAALSVRRFQDLGIDVVMLTGDSIAVAQEVCTLVGIPTTSCQARLLPVDKLRFIQESERIGQRVMMIGDGINDAAALAGATVGVAMGAGGTAMACAAADIVMMSDNLTRLPATIKLCKLARAIIIQNCVFSIIIKIVAVVLAVVGTLKFWEAVLIDVGTLLAVILNGTRPLAFSGYHDSQDYVPAKALSFYDYMRSMSMSISGYSSNTNPAYVPLLVDEEAAIGSLGLYAEDDDDNNDSQYHQSTEASSQRQQLLAQSSEQLEAGVFSSREK